jgi:hypothetical protein
MHSGNIDNELVEPEAQYKYDEERNSDAPTFQKWSDTDRQYGKN